MPDMFEKPRKGDWLAALVCGVIFVAVVRIIIEVIT